MGCTTAKSVAHQHMHVCVSCSVVGCKPAKSLSTQIMHLSRAKWLDAVYVEHAQLFVQQPTVGCCRASLCLLGGMGGLMHTVHLRVVANTMCTCMCVCLVECECVCVCYVHVVCVCVCVHVLMSMCVCVCFILRYMCFGCVRASHKTG